LLATWFGVGLLPKAPGTYASLAALPCAWLIHAYAGAGGLALAAAAVAATGCWATAIFVRDGGLADPPAVVVDEVVGQWLALLAAPPVWWAYALAFALFRFFDIAKPWPVSWAERAFPGAWGVMLDDVVAGAYAAAGVALVARVVP
jgi:phosphatidylglycerophosphatase A